MKWFLFVLLAGAIIGGLFLFFVDPNVVPKNSPPPNQTILMFGDSLTEGVGAKEGEALPDQLSKILGQPVLNFGVAGDTTEKALARIEEALNVRPGIAIILLGGNDALRRLPKKETEKNLREIVTQFQSAGAMTVLVGVRGGLLGDPYDGMYEQIAKESGSLLVPDILAGIFGRSHLMSDGIHPNSAGYALAAKRLADTIEPFLLK